LSIFLLTGGVVFGGERLGGTSNQDEVYDPARDSWGELAPMPMGVHGSGAATVGDTIYIPAGAPLNGGTTQTNGNQTRIVRRRFREFWDENEGWIGTAEQLLISA
jgi:hypothetical protein